MGEVDKVEDGRELRAVGAPPRHLDLEARGGGEAGDEVPDLPLRKQVRLGR